MSLARCVVVRDACSGGQAVPVHSAAHHRSSGQLRNIHSLLLPLLIRAVVGCAQSSYDVNLAPDKRQFLFKCVFLHPCCSSSCWREPHDSFAGLVVRSGKEVLLSHLVAALEASLGVEPVRNARFNFGLESM